MALKLQGRVIVGSHAVIRGKALVMDIPISFLGDVDPETGIIRAHDSVKKGQSIRDRILVLRGSRGSTVGSYILYALRENNVAPKAIIAKNPEPIVIVGCIISDIPLVDLRNDDFFNNVKDEDIVTITPTGVVYLEERSTNSTRRN